MHVLVLGLNFAPEEVGIAPYTTGLVGALLAAGHRVDVIAGKPYYPGWRVPPRYRGVGYIRSDEGGAVIVRCPHYVPTNPTGLRRILHHLSFALTSLPPALRAAGRHRPQVVLAVAPSLMSAPVARLTARICGARSWLHIQDFEIEAAFATGLMRPDSILGRFALRFQQFAFRGFDVLSSISPQMCSKLTTRAGSGTIVFELRNWSDLARIERMKRPSVYRDEWAIDTPHVALYSGNIANKQGIDLVVKAARLLRERQDLTFIVCGEGPQRDHLVASGADLRNIRFYPLQPAERLSELLGLATVHLLPQLAGAADLVLPSKLTNMLASGRPVITTADAGTGLAAEVAGCGRVTPAGDAAAFAQAIAELIDAPDLAAQFGAAARRRAEERWSGEQILARFIEKIEWLGASGGGHP